MSQIKVNFELFVDDKTNPDERILAFQVKAAARLVPCQEVPMANCATESAIYTKVAPAGRL